MESTIFVPESEHIFDQNNAQNNASQHLENIFLKNKEILLEKQNHEVERLNNKHKLQNDRLVNLYEKEKKKIFNKRIGGNGGIALDNETRFVNKITEDSEYKKSILEQIITSIDDIDEWDAVKCNKDNGCIIQQTESWKNCKLGTGEKAPTSKSDIAFIKKDLSESIGISLKSGEGRATSADYFESNAIFTNVLQNNSKFCYDENLKELVNMLTDNFLSVKLTNSKLNKREMDQLFKIDKEKFEKEYISEYEWYIKLVDSCRKCNELWRNVCETFPVFKISIIKECLSGKYKFGNNIGKANFLIKVRDSTSTEIMDIYNLDSDKDNYINYCSTIGNGNVFACKSSGSTLWMRFL